MKKIVISALLALVVFSVEAQSVESVLNRLKEAMPALGNYQIAFTVSADKMGDSKGTLRMSGERYRITVGDQQQFSDGRYRYEVNGTDREVTIGNNDTKSRNLLNNPIHAFDFGADGFESSLIEQNDAVSVIALVPRKGVLDGVDRVVVYLSRRSGLPEKMKYDFRGSQLTITIDSIERPAHISSAEFDWSPDSYRGYEIIDFR